MGATRPASAFFQQPLLALVIKAMAHKLACN